MTDRDEPLDLGATELSAEEERRVRREHDLDDPAAFDERNAIDDRAEPRMKPPEPRALNQVSTRA